MKATTILVPLDGSKVAEVALAYAEAIARATGASLRLFTVIDVEAIAPGRAEEIRQSLVLTNREGMEGYLHATARTLQDRGVMTEVMAVTGNPLEEILAAGAESDIGLTVISTHGRGGVERWFIGSVADKVMRLTSHPVLLVSAADTSGHVRHVRLQRLLVPLDGSPEAEAALPVAEELAKAAGAAMTLLRVEPWLTTVMVASPYVPDLGRAEAEVEAAAYQYLDGARGKIHGTGRVDTQVLRGAPAVELANAALDGSADLVVMTTHGRGGLKRLVLGSCADRLVRSGAPVLLVRAAAAGDGLLGVERSGVVAGAGSR